MTVLFRSSTHRLVGFLLVMAIMLAGRAMFTATSTLPTATVPMQHLVLPLAFIAASASSWTTQYQQQQQPNTTKMSSAIATTKESPATGSRVKDQRQQQRFQEQSSRLLFLNKNNNSRFYFNAQAQTSPLVIFYNIFIPPESETTDADVDKVDTARGGTATTIGMNKIQNALRIVTEQIQQIRHSHAAITVSPNNNNINNKNQTTLTVFYNTMGNPTALNHSFMQNLCTGPLQSNGNGRRGGQSSPKIHCRHLQHFTVGHEEKTLNHLHSFCLQHSNHSVVYLHSKGSFHHRPYNEAWRPHLTAAATSRLCLDAIVGSSNDGSSGSSRSSACNLCSLQFYPIWSMLVPGNMWMASCDYVQKLLPLPLFQARMKQVEQAVQRDLHHAAGSIRGGGDGDDSSVWKATLYPWSPMTVGTRRWSNEHWIASHPHVVPCDLSQTARLQPWQKQQHQQPAQEDQHQQSVVSSRQMLTTRNEDVTMKQMKREYLWAMAPRHPITSMRYELNLKRLHNLLQLSNVTAENVTDNGRIAANDRLREWFLLPGFLVKWNVLYNHDQESSSLSFLSSFPSSSSWIWKWFPDGDYWKASVQKWGLNQTVARMLQPHHPV